MIGHALGYDSQNGRRKVSPIPRMNKLVIPIAELPSKVRSVEQAGQIVNGG